MIEPLLRNAHLLHQTADDENELIFMSQEARYICINRATVNELRKLLRELAKREIGE